jgi:hypothetical protein
MTMESSPEKSRTFNPQIAFFDLRIVKWTILIGLLIVFFVIVIIVRADPRATDLTASGFNEAFRMLKVPIWMLGAIAALLALYATNHRSEQNKMAMHLTESSIRAAGAQNRFANYYKHVDEFSKYVDAVSTRNNNPKSIDARLLHHKWYPQARMVISLNNEITERFRLHLIGIIEYLRHFDEFTQQGFQDFVVKVDTFKYELNKVLQFSFDWKAPYASATHVAISGRTYYIYGNELKINLKGAVNNIRCAYSIMIFDPDDEVVELNHAINFLEDAATVFPRTNVLNGLITAADNAEIENFRRFIQGSNEILQELNRIN